MPRLALDPDQASRFQGGERLFTDGPGDPEAITERLADGYGRAPHRRPGADGAGEQIPDRMGSLAGHGPLLRDRAEKKKPRRFRSARRRRISRSSGVSTRIDGIRWSGNDDRSPPGNGITLLPSFIAYSMPVNRFLEETL